MNDIISLISVSGVIASMVFIGWQMRQGTHQRRISNAMAGTSGLRATLEHLHAVQRLFVDRPQLRPYFNDGKRCPSSGEIRHQVEAVAEMYADVLEVGIATNEQIPSTDSVAEWLDYSAHMLTVSPTIELMVLDKPRWWPRLAMLAQLRNSAESNSGEAERSPNGTVVATRGRVHVV